MKKMVVLDHQGVEQETGTNLFAWDEGSELALFMPADEWADMDRPRQITLTIEPGDTINEEDEEEDGAVQE